MVSDILFRILIFFLLDILPSIITKHIASNFSEGKKIKDFVVNTIQGFKKCYFISVEHFENSHNFSEPTTEVWTCILVI